MEIINPDCIPPKNATQGNLNFNWGFFEHEQSEGEDIRFFVNEFFINNAIWAAFYGDNEIL